MPTAPLDDALRSLAGVPTNVLFARAALAGGAVPWCDRPDAPRAFHVVHPCGMSLVWGDAVDQAVPDVVAHLRSGARAGRAQWLQVDPRWDHVDWDAALDAVPASGPLDADPARVVRHARLNLRLDPGDAPGRAAPPPPAPWRPRRATAADRSLPGTVVPGDYWPDARTFLAAGGGWVLADGPVVGAIAFVAFRHGTEAEIGVETAPAWRRLGLAAAAAGLLVDDLLGRGLSAVWSCREGNAASAGLAASLGFRPTGRLPYYQVPAVASVV